MATTTEPKLSPADIASELEREPLVGVTVASEILGIKASNFRRDAVPHLTPVPVEGSANVYFRSEVRKLAQTRARRRAAAAAAQENGSS